MAVCVAKYAGAPKEAWGCPRLAPSRFFILPRTPEPRPAPDVNLTSLLERMQTYVFRRRVRVKDTFEDYDPLHCGRCTVEQFARAVKQVLPILSEPEIQELTARFTEGGSHSLDTQVVHYLEFVRALDGVFATQGLEKRPTAVVERPGARLRHLDFRPRPVEDEARLQQLLHRLALLSRGRGIDIRTCFQDCERSNAASLVCPRYGGKVTQSQFRQHLPFVEHMEASDIKMLMYRYMTPEGDVSYEALDKDVQAVDLSDPRWRVEPPASMPPPPPRQSSRPQPTLEDVLERIRHLVLSRRLQLSGTFQDFDRLRRGVCNASQLGAVLTLLNVEASSHELRLLMEEFSDGAGGFYYRDFIRCLVDNPEPLGLPPATGSDCQPAEDTLLRDVELRFAKHMQQTRSSTRLAFQDFDHMRTGKVTKPQFLRVMDMLQFKMDGEEAAALWKAYADGGSPAARFSYYALCASLQDLLPSLAPAPALASRPPPRQVYSARGGRPPARYFDRSGQVVALQSARGPRPLSR